MHRLYTNTVILYKGLSLILDFGILNGKAGVGPGTNPPQMPTDGYSW